MDEENCVLLNEAKITADEKTINDQNLEDNFTNADASKLLKIPEKKCINSEETKSSEINNMESENSSVNNIEETKPDEDNTFNSLQLYVDSSHENVNENVVKSSETELPSNACITLQKKVLVTEETKNNIDKEISEKFKDISNQTAIQKDNCEKTETSKSSAVTDGKCSSPLPLVESLQNKNGDSKTDIELKENYSKDLDIYEMTSLDNEDTEEEVEDVEIPEEVDELIVPDEGDETCIPEDAAQDVSHRPDNDSIDEDLSKDSELEGEEDEETSNPKCSEEEDLSHQEHIESELVALGPSHKDSHLSGDDQTTNDADVDNTTTANDPLNYLETNQTIGKEKSEGTDRPPVEEDLNSDAYQEDDDDVEFIETRNSPICIESDEEDSKETETSIEPQILNLPKATITFPKDITVTRTSARKSTARPQSASSTSHSMSHSGGKVKRFSYLDKATTYSSRRSLPSNLQNIPQQVVDTIEVLDSSDEDSSKVSNRPSTTQIMKTPPKRTLLAAKGSNNKVPNKASFARRGGISASQLATHIKKQSRKPAPPPLPPATPQSNFLNNVQLQPASSGTNPPAFSALLSNKSVIIPNAFYGNHPSTRINPPDADMERRYVRWLETFITQFSNPQLVASHSCFVLLQRALKYKDFVRIKGIRTTLNMNAQKATDHLNHQLMLDMRSIFLKSSKEITPHGRRFCEMACTTPQNKTVTLLIHAITGRIILKSSTMEVPSASAASPTTSLNNSSAIARKRQMEEDEYVPVRNKLKASRESNASENVEEDEEGRKRSLRSKRAKRIDNSFSYNEDDLAVYDVDEEEEAERVAQAEVQRKIDQKRLEAQRQRQQQAKSFENAFIQAFAKSIDGKESNKGKQPAAALPNKTEKTTGQRARVNSSMYAVQQHLANNDAEDLLQATWIENVENEDTQIISDDEEPKQHRIYKQMQMEKQQKSQMQQSRIAQKHLSSNVRNENSPYQQLHLDARHWPKNTDLHLHAMSKNKDICVICKLNVQRIVHHYVNEHRGCEVYNSRLTSSQVEHLRRGASTIFNVSLYKNGQPQYEAHCIFCQKLSKFMLPYWIQHFTMHTGEYAYRCSGCGIRKPTRSLLTQHHAQGCPQNGTVLQDYTHDTKKIRVEARICTLCNYVQLHRNNIVKHLHQQHGIKQILPKHIQTIVLLKVDATTKQSSVPPATWTSQQREKTTTKRQKQSFASSSSTENTYVIDDDDQDDAEDADAINDDDTLLFGDTIQSIPEQQHHQQPDEDNALNYSYNYVPPYMRNASSNNNNSISWEENDPAEDLSFMICGMLDVQMNNAD